MTDTQPQSGWKRVTYRVLVSLFVLSFIVSTVAVWANYRIQDSDSWTETVAPLATDPAIKALIVDQASNLIEEQIRADAEAGLLRNVTINQTMGLVRVLLNDFVNSHAFAEFWNDANHLAHSSLLYVINGGDSDLLKTDGQNLVLDLQPVVDWINPELNAALPGSNYVINLASEHTSLVLYSDEGLEKLINTFDLIDTLAFIMPIVMLVSLAGALLVATNRKAACGQLALVLTIGAAIVLVAIAIAKVLIANAQPEQNQQAIAALLHIVLIDLVRAFRIAAAVGLVVTAVIALMQASSRRGLSVGAFLQENREILAGVGFGLGALYLILSDNPTPWVAVISLGVIVIGLLARAIWRKGSNPEGAQL